MCQQESWSHRPLIGVILNAFQSKNASKQTMHWGTSREEKSRIEFIFNTIIETILSTII